MGSKPEIEGGIVKHPVPSKRSLIEQRLRNVRGVADSGLSTDDVMRLTRGEKVSVRGRSRSDGKAGASTSPGERRALRLNWGRKTSPTE